MFWQVSFQTWKSNLADHELFIQGYLAMHQMATEFKNMTRLVEINPAVDTSIKFETKYVDNNTPDVETVIYRYFIPNKAVFRSPTGGSSYFVIAGCTSISTCATEPVSVQTLVFTPYTTTVGGILIPITIPPGSYSDVVAIQIDMTLKDIYNNTVHLNTLARLRNI